jgi:hypothetical protein
VKHDKLSIVREIMDEFTRSTGISPGERVPRRYLWTDAFAVCNFLELYRQTSEDRYKELALQLVDQVHEILGRHREDDPRTGWISGLDEQNGRLHPTVGGLRIGKKMNERRPDEPYDEHLEWDRDGQYYHYLTKWMHALDRVGTVTGDPVFKRWAVELAKTVHARFTAKGKMIRWKMSIDLSYPLVPAMGQHDPLDGLITFLQLQAGAAKGSKGTGDIGGSGWPGESAELDLSHEIVELARICSGKSWSTYDPLGIGGLMSDAYRLVQAAEAVDFERGGEDYGRDAGAYKTIDLLGSILDGSHSGLDAYARTSALKAPASYRLAFRELGLAIGLHAVERMQKFIESAEFTQGPPGISSPPAADRPEGNQRLRRQIESLSQYVPLAKIIEDFWLMPASQEADSFTEHRDINMVMLATSLIPDGFLTL